MRISITALLALASLAAHPAVSQTTSFSLAGDFSIVNNGGSSPWAYGTEDGGDPFVFYPLTTNTRTANDLWGTDFSSAPAMWSDGSGYWGIGKNTSGAAHESTSGMSWNPDEVLLRPKATYPFPGRLVIAWTAPSFDASSNVINVTYSFEQAISGIGQVGLNIIHRKSKRDLNLFPFSSTTADGPISGTLTGLAVMPGDQLFFRIDSWGPDVEEDITKAFIDIEIVPGIPGEPYASATPRQIFSETLEEQEMELKTNELMQRFAISRDRLSADPYRPIYHFVSPESQLNDPNGLTFWQGRWHLFYQAYPPDEYPDPSDIPKRRQHWGHAVSEDLVHWRDLPYAIYPGIEKMCFSGSTVVESDRVIAYYPGVAAGQMVAVADDPLLLNWDKLPECPLSPMGDSCIWKEGDTYYGLTGLNLASSTDLVNWTSHGAFLQDNPFEMGDAYACPGFVPIGDKHILTSFSHTYGGQYLLGDYDQKNHKFTPYAMGRFNHGRVSPGGVHAPSIAADGKGGAINILNINDGKHSDDWDQIMSLAQQLTLGPDSQLRIAPVATVESLRTNHQHVGETVLPANQEIVLNQIQGNAMELDVEIDPQEARWVRLNVLRSPDAEEYTSITFYNFDRALSIWYHTPGEVVLDGSRSSRLPDVWLRPPERTVMQRRGGETLRLRVFVDRSVVEVFVNERKYLAMRVYPGREDSLGVSLEAQGQAAVLKSLDAWQMNSIYDDVMDPVIEPDGIANQAYSGQLFPVGAKFTTVSGPEWLTIEPDGSIAGTPSVFDSGLNWWYINIKEGGAPATLMKLQITVDGTCYFAEDFNSYIGNQNASQADTGLDVAYGGKVAGWTSSGVNAIHAVDLGKSDWAAMFYKDNAIELSSGIPANDAGVKYTVAFDYGSAAYDSQAGMTTAADALSVQVLRADGSVLASDTYGAGPWGLGNYNLEGENQGTLVYYGDGSGSVRLRISASEAGYFEGMVDNVIVK